MSFTFYPAAEKEFSAAVEFEGLAS